MVLKLPSLGNLTKTTAIRLAEHLVKLDKDLTDEQLTSVLEFMGWDAEKMVTPGEAIAERWLGPAMDVQMLKWWMKRVRDKTADQQSDAYEDWASLAVGGVVRPLGKGKQIAGE
jgi:hypothetical protein